MPPPTDITPLVKDGGGACTSSWRREVLRWSEPCWSWRCWWPWPGRRCVWRWFLRARRLLRPSPLPVRLAAVDPRCRTQTCRRRPARRWPDHPNRGPAHRRLRRPGQRHPVPSDRPARHRCLPASRHQPVTAGIVSPIDIT